MTDVLVLCYHAVSPSWTGSLSVTPDALERQLAYLVRRGWRATTFSEAVLEPPAHRTLAITFDDAFASVRELAWPVLSELGLPATVFAPTAFMSRRQRLEWAGIDHWRSTPDAGELICMSWDDLGELAEQGWEIGSHTRTHPQLTTLDDAALRDELDGSRRDCAQHLGRPCRSIAYPYGEVDRRVADNARRSGYLAGAALSGSLRRLGPHRWPRVGIYHGDIDRRFRLKMTPVTRRLRASRLWPSPERSSTAALGA
jgi:peptidoglycan/xylan/chitin deacetylase (PgdA/CDA1 family)